MLPVGLNLKNIAVLQAVIKWCQMETWINTKDWNDQEMVNMWIKIKDLFPPHLKFLQKNNDLKQKNVLWC